MLRLLRAGFLAFALLSGLLLGLASARPMTVAELAAYEEPDRQTVLEEGSRREGRVLVYATGTQIDPLVQAFQQKYPFVTVELYRGGSDEIARKVVEEYSARHYVVDAFELASHGLIVPRDMGILQPFKTPEVRRYDPGAVEPGGHWIVARESYTGLGFNTSLVRESEAPRTYDDLLDPTWRGRMAMSGSISTAANWVGTLVITRGEAFVRQLGQQNIRVYDVTGRALANLMIAGEVALSPTIYSSHVQASRARGAPLAWRALGPVPVTDTGVALAARAPHPHAALLFIDFLLSREGQEIYRSIGYDSARLDMPGGERPREVVYLAARPNYVREFEQWVRLYQQVFLRGAR